MALDLQERPHHKEAETDFSNKPTVRRWFWKGDHKACNHGTGVCDQPKGWCNSASGAVVPQIVPFPTDKRHRVVVEEEGPNASGDLAMGWEDKGFIALKMEVGAGLPPPQALKLQKAQQAELIAEIVSRIRPSEEVVSELRALGERERRSTAYEEKHTVERTDKDIATFLSKFDAANKAPKREASNGRT